jgi:hypothetical protein
VGVVAVAARAVAARVPEAVDADGAAGVDVGVAAVLAARTTC